MTEEGLLAPRCFDEQKFTWSWTAMANGARLSEPGRMLKSLREEEQIDYSRVREL